MNLHPSRRDIIQTGAAAGALGFLSRIPLLGKEDVQVDPSQVQFRPEIEPLVRLLEETPRERLLEEVASRIKKGTT